MPAAWGRRRLPEEIPVNIRRCTPSFLTRISCAVFAVGALSIATEAAATEPENLQSFCAARNKGPYGFQCQGWVNAGAGLEPVTFLGTVRGSNAGVYNGSGIFSASLGSTRQRVSGQAVFENRSCTGQIAYKVWLQTPGGEVPLPDLTIAFVPVAGGAETLGVPIAPPGVTGDAVPRMACRLVRLQGD